jgi:hypothetical protein
MAVFCNIPHAKALHPNVLPVIPLHSRDSTGHIPERQSYSDLGCESLRTRTVYQLLLCITNIISMKPVASALLTPNLQHLEAEQCHQRRILHFIWATYTADTNPVFVPFAFWQLNTTARVLGSSCVCLPPIVSMCLVVVKHNLRGESYKDRMP